MIIVRSVLAVVLAINLAAAIPGHAVSPANAVIGVVTQAMDANLGTGSVSVGATVYDGDLLSTDEDGALTFRAQTATLYLSRQSAMVLHGLPGRLNGTAAHLDAGTLVFSTANSQLFEVYADEAQIRAAADAPTIGQVTVAGPKMLYIYARQGSLVFSYREETHVIAEGQSYRVLLDPAASDDGSANKPGDDQGTKKTTRRRPLAVLLPFAVVAIGATIATISATESPDHP
jgi:hypothetical protein